jgi:hypothetical protein
VLRKLWEQFFSRHDRYLQEILTIMGQLGGFRQWYEMLEAERWIFQARAGVFP